MNFEIPDSEKAVLDAIMLENPKLKISQKKRWVDYSMQSGYYIEEGHITKIRLKSEKKGINIPEIFDNLIHLKELDLGTNNLTSLPECLMNLGNLQKLNLERNNFLSLPDNFGTIPCS